MNALTIYYYLRTPWLAGGRDIRTGCDCWGLVRCILATEFGISMPSYDNAVVLDAAADPAHWYRVELTAARAGDVCVMLRDGAPTHVGIFVDAEKVMHHDARGARCEDYRDLMVSSPIVDVYRCVNA